MFFGAASRKASLNLAARSQLCRRSLAACCFSGLQFRKLNELNCHDSVHLIIWHIVDSKKLEHGCRLVYTSLASFFGLVLETVLFHSLASTIYPYDGNLAQVPEQQPSFGSRGTLDLAIR